MDSSVKYAIKSVIKAENFTFPPMIHLTTKSRDGGGFTTNTCAVTITGTDKTLELFMKYRPKSKQNGSVDMYRSFFSSEIHFYEEIFPGILKFQQERNAECIFDNVPKYYPVESKGTVPAVVLDNLKMKGFKLRDDEKGTEETHIILGLKTYAKFHATSFAMKDQEPELFAKLCSGINDPFTLYYDKFGFQESIGACIKSFVKNMGNLTDTEIYDKCIKLSEDLIDFGKYLNEKADGYSVICHGDCWSNNFMYFYDEKMGIPTEIKLLDWQLVRCHSPVIDISYFFYGIATKDNLRHSNRYMQFYYDTLRNQIAILGSDPDKIYPKDIFVSHLKKFFKFGLLMAFTINRIVFQSADEIHSMVNEVSGTLPIFPDRFKREDEFNEKMAELVRHCIQQGFL